MIENIERIENLFYVKITGKITKEDVEEYVIPMVKKMISECKKVKFLVFLDDVTGYTFGGFLADFSFFIKNMNAFKDIAVVGSNDSIKKLTENFSKFFNLNAKYFDVSKSTEAREFGLTNFRTSYIQFTKKGFIIYE